MKYRETKSWLYVWTLHWLVIDDVYTKESVVNHDNIEDI